MRPGYASPGVLWRNPRLWAGAALSVVFLWLALRGVSIAELADALAIVDYGPLVPATALTIVILWLRALRWGVLLRSVKPVSARSLFRVTAIGYLVNYILPVRAGELARAHLIGIREGIVRSTAFATVVVDRLLDVLGIILIFGVLMMFSNVGLRAGELDTALRFGGGAMLVLGVVISLLLWTLRQHTAWWKSRIQAVTGRVWRQGADPLAWLVTAFARGVLPGLGKGDGLLLVLYSALTWFLTALQVMVLADGMHIHIPWEAGWVMIIALAIGVTLPSAPGFVGTFEYAVIVCLLLYGVSRPEAVMFALLLHAISVLPIVVLGLAVVWADGLSVGGLLRPRH